MYAEGNIIDYNSIYYNNDKLVLKIRIMSTIKSKIVYLKGYYKLNMSSKLINNIQINEENLVKKTIKSYKSRKINNNTRDYYFNITKHTDFLPIDYCFVDNNLNNTFNENYVQFGKSYGLKLKIKKYNFNMIVTRLQHEVQLSNIKYAGRYIVDDPKIIFIDKYGKMIFTDLL